MHWRRVMRLAVAGVVALLASPRMPGLAVAQESVRPDPALVAAPLPLRNAFLGGATRDAGFAVAVDALGNIYVTGESEASWGDPIRPFAGYTLNAFVAKLDAGGGLLWNTFLGSGVGLCYGKGIAVDAAGNVYVGGTCDGSWGEPIRPLAWGGFDAFVARLDTNGALQWNTFLGGSGDLDVLGGLAVDGSGGVFIAGYSDATWGAPLRAFGGGSRDAFAAALDADGTLLWNTFLGGGAADYGRGVAVDASSRVAVLGESGAGWGSPIHPHSADAKAFVARLDSGGSLLWSTFLGGGGAADYGRGIAVEAGGAVYVANTSNATWGDPIRPFTADYPDISVAKLDADGSLVWNTFLGGAFIDLGLGIAVDAGGSAYVAGLSDAPWGDPLIPWADSADAVVAKLGPDGALLWHAFLGGPGWDQAEEIKVGAGGGIVVAGSSDAPWGSPTRPFAGAPGIPDAFVAVIGNPLPVAFDQTVILPEDAEQAITLAATDSAGFTLAYTILTPPSHGTLSGEAPHLTYHPAADYCGPDSFTFAASDGVAVSTAATVSLTVTPVNDPPFFPPLGELRTVEGDLLEFAVAAADPDGESPTISASLLPDRAVFDPVTGLFAWRPRFDQAGDHLVSFTATDAAGGSATVTVTIAVSPPVAPIFHEDFADGSLDGDPDWLRVAGKFVGVNGEYVSISTKGINLSRVDLLDPVGFPLGSGAIKARVRLTSTAGPSGPNAVLVFACRDATRYRWVKITPSRVLIGQRGTLDGVTAGTKKAVRARHIPGKWYDVTVRISPDGWVRVYRGSAAVPAASFRFASGSGPSVVPGGIGLAADGAKTRFDDVTIWEGSASGP